VVESGIRVQGRSGVGDAESECRVRSDYGHLGLVASHGL
jgi:hypothetical protein